ncbi:hypothetical protein ABIF68_007848 [Bradyrhizobium japonicum]|jgi:hypothetical protein|uniref:hypothetical protein n=1 Tax=Bradyrhizobium TaxID=374 RepID=UPI0004BA3421|nr:MULTISPECIES: hypothetical protein [Bradyrhizobium]MDI2071534.1 hypothetical protein [Bradyrhizobium sp. Mp27]
MTIFLLVLALFVALAFIYALILRPWLKKQAWAQGFFASVDTLESALFKKSETILVGRLLWVGGLFVTFYDSLATFAHTLDLTPLTTRIFDWLQIPPDMRNLSATAAIGIIGLLINRLRKTTTKPLDVVALPQAQVTPAAAQAIARADVANQQAVKAVEEAKN